MKMIALACDGVQPTLRRLTSCSICIRDAAIAASAAAAAAATDAAGDGNG